MFKKSINTIMIGIISLIVFVSIGSLVVFPVMERKNGIRRFGEAELEALRVIEYLKRSGLGIKDIKLFTQWCAEGPAIYPQRKKLFACWSLSCPGAVLTMKIPF